jgi:hypothetical protein
MTVEFENIANFGSMRAGQSDSVTAGDDSSFGDETVTAAITNDSSGGRFTVTSIATYHMGTVDPEELPPHHQDPAPKALVVDARVNGSGPLAVRSSSSLIGVRVAFTAPTKPGVYTATVLLTGSGGHKQAISARAEVVGRRTLIRGHRPTR